MCKSLFSKEVLQTMIYICSRYRPLAVEPVAREAEKKSNIERAKTAAFFVSELGFEAMCPHLYTNQFLDDDIAWQRELGMQIGLDWLELSGEMWIFR